MLKANAENKYISPDIRTTYGKRLTIKRIIVYKTICNLVKITPWVTGT